MPRQIRLPNPSLLGAEGFSLWRILRLGEPFIWLAGAACAVILFMILVMLALVLFEGAAFFWPRPVEQVLLKDGTVLAGIVRDRETYEAKDEQGRVLTSTPRFQLMVGNRDLGGADFVWVDSDQVVSRSFPGDVLYLERQEWGPMVAWPLALAEGGKQVLASQPGFAAAFDTALDEARRRRGRLRRLEKHEIGALNRRMEAARLAIRREELEARQERRQPDARVRSSAEAVIGKAKEAYAKLQAELESIRAADAAVAAKFRMADGQEKELLASAIVRAHAPNRMGLMAKAALYAARSWEFFFGEPRESNTEGGVFPAIFGTVMMSLIMSILVVPFGVVAALYLREYARQGPLVSAVRIAVNNLAGVPSIVFGVFGLGFFVYMIGGSLDQLFYPEALPAPTLGTGGILWASLTLALLTVPVVIVATEESLAFVPRGIRDGSLACGASKWQMIRTVVLPATAPGMLTGVILSMARGAGEVAPLMITGVVKLAPELPLDGDFPFFHLQRKFMHLGFHIYDVGFQSPNVEAAMPMVYTTTLLLIAVIVALNLAAMLIRNRLRKRYRSSVF